MMVIDMSGSDSVDQRHSDALRKLQSGAIAEALSDYKAIVSDNPDDTFALVQMGFAFEHRSENLEAAKAYRRALKVDAKCIDAAVGYSRLALRMGKPKTALRMLSKASSIKPESHDIWCDMGSVQRDLGQLKPAIKSFRRALEIDPHSSIANYNLGTCYRDAGKDRKAVALLRRAAATSPGSGMVISLMAAILSDLGSVSTALTLLDNHLRANPEDVDCQQARALIQLRAGNLSEGFENYEWRFAPAPQGVSERPFQQRLWGGQPTDSESVLVWLEQGIGDEILSLSLLNDISNSVVRCAVECDERLIGLVSRSFPNITVIPRKTPPDPRTMAFDLACPVWSAARFIRREWSDIPHHQGYLRPDQALVDEMRQRYIDIAGGRKVVGLSWASGAKGGQFKTPPLASWAPLFKRDDILLTSVQYAPAESDIVRFRSLGPTEIYVDPQVDTTSDLEQAAAQIAALDAVVSISNSSAHLAGALGIPVGCVISEGRGGFWYWHRNRDDSPWYPSLHLCRQSKPGQWDSAIEKVATWLDNCV